MKPSRRARATVTLLAAVALLAAACGDDGGAATTAPETTTTAAATTTSPAATTTQATTTTEATTTTASGAHPVWGIVWDSVWPAAGSTARYRLTPPGGAPVELDAMLSYGVEWDGGAWDRIQIGSTEPGEYGLTFYFDRSEPWAIEIWGLRANGPGMGPEGWITEYLDGGPLVDLSALPGTAPTLDVAAFVDSGQGEVYGPTGAVYAMEVVGVEAVEVAAGSFAASLHVRFGLGGEFFGVAEGDEITFFSDLWVEATQLILRWDPVPGMGGALELVAPWG